MYTERILCEVAFQYKITKSYGNGVHSFFERDFFVIFCEDVTDFTIPKDGF